MHNNVILLAEDSVIFSQSRRSILLVRTGERGLLFWAAYRAWTPENSAYSESLGLCLREQGLPTIGSRDVLDIYKVAG